MRLSVIVILLSVVLFRCAEPHISHAATFYTHRRIGSLRYNPVARQYIGYVALYENCRDSSYACWPGAGSQIMDWGVSPGGAVDRFIFRYATALADPGEIVVRFYTGTDSEKPYDALVTEFALSNLKGSPDRRIHSFDHDFKVPQGRVFFLPKGKFGYSFQVEEKNTGIKFARGGNGNDNMLWVGDKEYDRYLAKNYWSGLYMKLYRRARENDSIQISPGRLSFAENDTSD